MLLLVPHLIQNRNILWRFRDRHRFQVSIDIGQLLVRKKLVGKCGHCAGGSAHITCEALKVQRRRRDTRSVASTLTGCAVAVVAAFLCEKTFAVFSVSGSVL